MVLLFLALTILLVSGCGGGEKRSSAVLIVIDGARFDEVGR